ncbi:hypothetical protein HPP92_011007 [Vanilla planifolia]|uniref:Uncharacterized protein n=1 Tax=Vanilla planifolia TaxID=51239 RepID=A0A835R3G8_VANPL|nr:hypothetical protein HPP92_011007 [Vanilla planifolia]
MDEIAEAVNLQGEEVAEAVVDALIAFRLAIKVNAFDSVRILDASYTSKYFFNVLGHDKVHKEGNGIQSRSRPLGINSCASEGIFPGQREHIYDSKIDPGVSLSGGDNAVGVGLSDNSSGSHFIAQPSGKSVIVLDPRTEKFHAQGNEVSPERNLTAEKAGLVRPIFPWINGDGNTNTIVYRGLSRRIIGFIMQNPGILEEDIINKMDVLNPQSCRRLLDTLVLDNYIMP